MTTPAPGTFLLIGTRSQLGAAILPKLTARGDAVVAVARTAAATHPKVNLIQGRLPEIPEPARPYQAIICFGPMDKLAEWLEQMRSPPALRVVATSSMSAVSKASARFEEDREIALRLQEGERRLRTACARHRMPCLILRPTMIYGLGLDMNLSAVATGAMKRGLFFGPRSKGLRQPVHADDVAEAALRAALANPALDETIEIGGGERLTVLQMFSRTHRSLPRKTFYIPVPDALMSVLARFSRRYRGAVSRLNSDLVADNTRLQAALGLEPRSFRPDPSTWPDR